MMEYLEDIFNEVVFTSNIVRFKIELNRLRIETASYRHFITITKIHVEIFDKINAEFYRERNIITRTLLFYLFTILQTLLRSSSN